MAAAPLTDPLRDPPPTEVPLKNPPLLRVIAQVRFPTLLAVRSADRVSGFQDALRDQYPYLEREDIAMLLVGPISVPEASHEVVVHRQVFARQSLIRRSTTACPGEGRGRPQLCRPRQTATDLRRIVGRQDQRLAAHVVAPPAAPVH